MSRISIYTGDPTVGLTDGDKVSTSTGAEPIHSGSIVIPASGYEDGDPIKLALRCDSGYETEEHNDRHAQVTIEDGTHEDKWRVALTSEGLSSATWGAALNFNSQIKDGNVIFYAQARAHQDESDPVNDDSVDIKVNARIAAADE